jgi:hypothetical protein
MRDSFKEKMLKQLNQKKFIEYKQVLDICNAFQITSGQDFAIGCTYAILDFILKDGHIDIRDFENQNQVRNASSINEFLEIINSIDKNINLKNDPKFSQYFSSPPRVSRK